MDDPILYQDRTGDALKAALQTFNFGSRRTGRTDRLIAMLQPGDRIVCAHEQEATLMRDRLALRRVDGVEVVAWRVRGEIPSTLTTRKMPTYFSHEWYESYYRTELEIIEERRADIERSLQGPRREMEHVFRLDESQG